jgi:hypothetical protein
MRLRRVSIVEESEGWTVGGVKVYPSALEALRATQREDKEAADRGDDVATIIEWTATSRIGRAVLAVITNQES